MKFSENWLRTFTDPKLDSEGLARVLTMAGLEVEALESAAAQFANVVVAQVLEVNKHPDADRLNVCKVDVGQAEPLQIVCGALNVAPGMKVPCALVDAQLPGLTIKRAKVRGIESFGMLCSAKELQLSDDSSGLLVLPLDAPVGENFRTYRHLDDKIFTLKLTPNRSDCLSISGVAREVAALTDTPLHDSAISALPVTSSKTLQVTLLDTVACPRYTGRVIEGVTASVATPEWMVQRLERSGLRSISAVVDVTNYVMLELGQPLHAFDLDKLHGGITVRSARQDEPLALLNGQCVTLSQEMLVIADDKGAVALGGIMGGEGSAVDTQTTNIFLESAFFAPEKMVGKARKLGLSSDSSYRFERGVDFAGTRQALERATQLIIEICGGMPGAVTEVIAELPARNPIHLRPERAHRVLGIQFNDPEIAALLKRLGLPYARVDTKFSVTPPSYRFDLSIEEDLIEELARVFGYDNIPAIAPKNALRMLPVPESRRSRAELSRILVARDYQEIVSYSFVDLQWEQDLAGNNTPVTLLNPIASHMSVMRSTMFGSLVNCLRLNLNHKQSRVRLFEVGLCFHRTAEGFDQPQMLGGLCYGSQAPEQWGIAERNTDFFDVKADIEALYMPQTLRFEAAVHPALHPGRSAKIWCGETFAGWLGELHPQWQQKYELPKAPVLFELAISTLTMRQIPAAQEVSKFPVVRRDIAIIVDEMVSVQALLDTLNENRPNTIIDTALFDIYRGKGVPENKKSLAFRVLMQDTQKTLTDSDVDGVIAGLVRIIELKHQATLRI